MSRRLADEVARLPEACERSDLSTAGVLRSLGFPERRLLLEVDDLADALSISPHLIPKWMARAVDQRLIGGWGIEKDGAQWRVQTFARGQPGLAFDDQTRAVAEFAFRYVQFISKAL